MKTSKMFRMRALCDAGVKPSRAKVMAKSVYVRVDEDFDEMEGFHVETRREVRLADEG